MKRLFLLATLTALVGAVLYALPPIQHYAEGVVLSVNMDKGLVVIAPANHRYPTSFIVQPNRTRLRRDNRPAALGELAPGMPVEIYWVEEFGEPVAIQVRWGREAT